MSIKPETNKILAASLEKLLETKSFDEVTIKDIIDECGASRTTFYRHFRDKYELMNWVYKNQVDMFIKENSDIGSWKNMLLEITCFIKEKQIYFDRIIRFTGQNSFNDFLFSYGVQYCKDRIADVIGSDTIPEEIVFSAEIYIAGTEFAIFKWIKSGFKLAPKEITKLMCDNMPLPLKRYFG